MGPTSTLITKFAAAFLVSLLGTGLMFGMAYIMVMRALKANRQEVEAWFEKQRVRLQAGPIPIIEKAQPVMLAALYAIYGRKVAERLRASFVIGLFFTGVIFVLMYSEYRSFPAALHEKKTQMERETDPKLFSYVTDPSLNPEYKKAWEGTEFYFDGGGYITYTNNEPIDVELRSRHDGYQSNFLARLSAAPDRVPITIMYLMQGTHVDPGFQRESSLLLFLFNVLMDFISVTIVTVCVRRLGKKLSMVNASVMFLFAASGTLMCAFVAFFSYHGFFCGQTRLFTMLLLLLPGTLLVTMFGAWIIWDIFFGTGDSVRGDDIFSSLLYLIVLAGISFTGCHYLWIYWNGVSFRFSNWHEVFAFPYILAVTTLVPAALTIVAFGLMLAAKIFAEPARVLPESYMTFVKEEVGGTQAAGLTLIAGAIAAVVAGLICAVN